MVENTKKRRNASTKSRNKSKLKDVGSIKNKKEIEKKETKEEKNINFKYIIKDYFKFYKQKLMRKHIITYIICLILFFVIIAWLISKINSTPNIAELAQNAKIISENSKGVFYLIISKKIPLIFMIIFAGIAPYFFIPVLGIGASYSLAVDIVTNFNVLTGKSSVIPMCIGAIIELIAVSLAIATGIEYCILSTKKWRYSRNQDYSMIDFKRTLYEATNNKKNLNEINKRKQEKDAKNEKNNVKIPYVYLFTSFVISVIVIAIGTIIAKV